MGIHLKLVTQFSRMKLSMLLLLVVLVCSEATSGYSAAIQEELELLIFNPSKQCPKVDGPTPTYIRDSNHCSVFYECSNGKAFRMKCPSNLYFDTILNVCNYRDLVDCDSSDANQDSVHTLNPDEQCPKVDGPTPKYIRDPTHCSVFYECSNGKAFRMKCPSNLHFDTTLNVCNYRDKVDCGCSALMKPTFNPDEQCPKVDGTTPKYIRDPTNCSVFYECSNGKAYRLKCPSNLYFDTTLNVCNYRDQVDCGCPDVVRK